ncbi:CDP-alcohol phosphatidyltransferase family protein [Kribbella sp. CA-253562]|uniref:CDP-alcohol phosphatidyltransferase family protein n=1 Tax=Kribbella sp. CA-253562 TaxID=3239942 RepID=UPI003D8EB526
MAASGDGSPVTAAVVLAVDRAEQPSERPRVLRRVGGVTVLERSVRALRQAGIERIVVAVGAQDAQRVATIASRCGSAEVVASAAGPGCAEASAVLAGLRVLGVPRCLIVTPDDIFESVDVRALVTTSTPNALAVIHTADLDGAAHQSDGQARVRLDDAGRVVALGPDLENFEALDAGLVVVDVNDLLSVAQDGQRSWREVLQSLAGAHQVRAVATRGLCARVNTPAGVRAAERRMWRRYGPKPVDSIVARLVYRRISGPITRLLLRTKITPDAATALAFAVTLGAAGLVATGHAWLMPLGGIGVVLGCALDGVDGELARISGTASRRGATLDTLLDRYADLAVVAAVAVAAGATATAWAIGFAAAAGCLLVSYVHAVGRDTDVRLLLRREFRLLILAAAAIAGFPLAGLIAVAVAANIDAVRGVVLLLRAMPR